jgi:hypothetical protein
VAAAGHRPPVTLRSAGHPLPQVANLLVEVVRLLTSHWPGIDETLHLAISVFFVHWHFTALQHL